MTLFYGEYGWFCPYLVGGTVVERIDEQIIVITTNILGGYIMNLVRFNRPVYGMNINNLFNEMMKEYEKPLRAYTCASVPVNIEETEKAFVLHFSAPGFEKENFAIKHQNSVLTVKGSKTEDENKKETLVKREFNTCNFERSFNMPDTVDVENISAKYNNGILVVELPKKEVELQKVEQQIVIQ